MGGIQRFDSACVYHMLPSAYEQENVCCWHCCEPITDKSTLIPLPRVYDTVERVYHVYGATCSPSCAKTYILEHTSFDRGQHLNVLVKMLREVYNVSNAVVTAPPRAAMKRFGGNFDPSRLCKANCAVLTPPFVSYCMLVEERAESEKKEDMPVEMDVTNDLHVEEADTLEEPHPPGIYSEYLKEMDGGEQMPESAEPDVTPDSGQRPKTTGKRLRDGNSSASASGPLSKFVKPRPQ